MRGSYGRRWGSAAGWHSAVEIPFNDKARRFFAERAAARELAYFVRSPVLRAARQAMRRGRAAPTAETIARRVGNRVVGMGGRDAWPPTGTIGVWTRGNRIVVARRVDGQRLFVEIERGKVARTNIRGLAFVF